MAIFDSSTSDDLINMANASFVAVGSYLTQDPTELEYLATDGTTRITLTGTFTYSLGVPTSGVVSQIAIDTSNDSDTDITISFTPAESPDVLDLIASADSFWLAALANNDTLTPSSIPAPGFVLRYYFGDFNALANGATLVAGSDLLHYGGGGGTFDYYADGIANSGNLTGGNDTVSFLAYQPTGAIYLDVSINNSTGTLIGGNDIITTTAPSTISAFSTFTVYGDANSNSGTVNGGDDDINVYYSANATVYGDVRLLAGTLTGGDDTIRGSFVSASGSGDILFGDVETINASATFTGGNDTIYGEGGEDTIYGDYKFDLGGTIVSEGNDFLDGGAGDDFIYGNGGMDILRGGADDDAIDGGSGSDLAGFDGLARTYGIGWNGASWSGSVSTAGSDGTDTLTSIEMLLFMDGYYLSGNAAVTARMYDSAFNRDADEGGLMNWTASLDGGLSVVNMANGFMGSAEFTQTYGGLDNTQFVTLLYNNVLGRGPEQGGLAHWVAQLDTSAATRADILYGFSESPEHIGMVASTLVGSSIWLGDTDAEAIARLYYATLDRGPDAGGLYNWISAFDGGTAFNTIASDLINSQEFQNVYGALDNGQFVTLLYSNVLDRTPDQGGYDHWTGGLGNGTYTREDVVIGFSDSLEFQNSTAPFMDDGIMLI